MWNVQRRITVCDKYQCNNEASKGKHCCRCGDDSCNEHAHIVDENNGFTRYVCDTCYSTCMLAYERTQQEKQALTINEPPVPGNTFTFYSVGKPINL